MTETDESGETGEGHGRRYLVGGKGAAAMRIRQECREQGRYGRRDHGKRKVRVRRGTLVCWYRDK